LACSEHCRAHGRHPPTDGNIFNQAEPEMVKNGHTRLTRNRACQQCFTGYREGALKQGHLWGSCRQKTAGNFFAGAPEFNDLFQLFLLLRSMPPRSSKVHAAMLFVSILALDLPKPIRPTFAAALHAVHGNRSITPIAEGSWQQRHQDVWKRDCCWGSRAPGMSFGHQQAGDFASSAGSVTKSLCIGRRKRTCFAVQGVTVAARRLASTARHKFGNR